MENNKKKSSIREKYSFREEPKTNEIEISDQEALKRIRDVRNNEINKHNQEIVERKAQKVYYWLSLANNKNIPKDQKSNAIENAKKVLNSVTSKNLYDATVKRVKELELESKKQKEQDER